MYNTFMQPEMLKIILKALRIGLTKQLGGQLAGLYLYGSQARGDSQPDSDIDVLVVLKEEFNYFQMLEKISYITSSLSLEHHTVISCVLMTEDEFEHRQTPLLMNIRQEGISV